jgi:hypothetical protein
VLHEPSIAKALTKANKAAESSQETLPLDEGITESLDVQRFIQIGIPHSWYISGQGACHKTRLNANDCIDGQDSTPCSMTSSIGEVLMAL